MERITEPLDRFEATSIRPGHTENQAIVQCAAYEDTGLTPDEITTLKQEHGYEHGKLNEEVSRRYQAECNYDHAVKDRDELKKALKAAISISVRDNGGTPQEWWDYFIAKGKRAKEALDHAE